MRRAGWRVLLIAGFVTASIAAAAETYPSKPVRVLTGYPPGGASESIGRIILSHMSTAFGQAFYLEGKPGAAGNVAGEVLVNAPPDGYTIYLAGLGVVAVNHALYGNMAYDPETAFAPISLVARLPLVLEVAAKVPVSSYPEFLTYAKSGVPLNHGSPGIGSMPHLAGELFKAKVGFQSQHVAYRGTGPFATAMMQSEVQWAFDVPNAVQTLLAGNFIKPLAITSSTRNPAFPTVPTVLEVGAPDFVMSTWFAFVAPAKTPRDIVERLSEEVRRGIASEEVATLLRNVGYDPAATTPEETARIFAADRERWTAVVKANGIKPE